MNQSAGIAARTREDDQAAALALFALWCGCAPPAPCALRPAFVLSGLMTSDKALLLHEAAALLAGLDAPCWLIVGANDLSVPDAALDVTLAHEAPMLSPVSLAAEAARPFRIGEHLMPPDLPPEAPVLIFGGYQRLATTRARLHQTRARFSLFGRVPRGSAGPADSPWAAALLPAAEREGFEWAILLGVSVAYDPPWRRDAA
jgi:hypothetical protein